MYRKARIACRAARSPRCRQTRRPADGETDPSLQRLQVVRGHELATEASFHLANELALGLTEEQLVMEHERLRARPRCQRGELWWPPRSSEADAAA
jgi:hypothetical protein